MMGTSVRKGVSALAEPGRWCAVILAGALLPLAGCSNFFQCQNKAACPASTGSGTGTGGGSTTGVDYAFVAYTTVTGNSQTSTLVEYNIAAGALTQVDSVALPFVPVAVSVLPGNGYVYVASNPGATSAGIYGFSIDSAGKLTALKNGGVLFNDSVGAMTISPDGKDLFTLYVPGGILSEYPVNGDGTLAQPAQVTTASLTGCALSVGVPVTQSCSIAVSPGNGYAVASLGTSGDVLYGYANGTGLTNNGAPIGSVAAGNQSGDFSVAIDGNSNAYVAQTAGVTVYQLTSTGFVSRGTQPYASGVVPRGIVVDSLGQFVFTANEGNGTISAFTTGTGTANALNGVTGSPFQGPANVSALGVDSTDSYLVAAGYDGSSGVQLWSIAKSGVLAKIASAGSTTSTQFPVLVAMSH